MAINRRLLVLDDEPGVLDAYRIILNPMPQAPLVVSSRRSSAQAAGAITPRAAAEVFEVTYVSSGEEALDTIRAAVNSGTPFAGGFFDVKLGPGIDGIEVIRQIKDLDPGLACVMVTAYQDRSLDEITRLFGEDFADRWDFLTKPFSHNEILQKARNLISNWDRKKREQEYLAQIQFQQEQLIRTERLAAIGTLARGIGHEFGNILMRIIGIAEIATQKKDLEETKQSLKVIASAAERAGVIVRNLQGLVKTEVKREPLDVREPIQEALLLVQHELKKASVDVVDEYSTSLPRISANKIEIGQVLLNLIINAVHAMEATGGKLTLRTRADGEGLAIEVTDTGHGIPAENMSKLFEPLFTTKGSKGTGLGLSVSRKIATNHGGTLTVTSEAGRGTTFRLWLPKGG